MHPIRCTGELLPWHAAPRRPDRPRRGGAWAVGLMLVLMLPAAHPQTGSAGAGRISPELQAVLARAGANGSVPFVVVLRAQADPLELRVEGDRLRLEGRPDEARARTIETLKGIAARTQSPETIFNGTFGSDGIAPGARTMAWENASNLNNWGLGPRSAIPRVPIDNNRGNGFLTENATEDVKFTSMNNLARKYTIRVRQAR